MDGVEKKVGDIVVCIILRDRIVFLLFKKCLCYRYQGILLLSLVFFIKKPMRFREF